MATLQQIGANGFAGVAPTPVVSYAINQYLVNDRLLNLMDFQNIAMGSNTGNLQANQVYYSGEGAEAAFRSIGVEYSVDNEAPMVETYQLKMLGGSFNVDRILERAFSQSPAALTNWREQQLQQKCNKIANGFAKYLLLGDSASDNKQFDGIKKYFEKWESQWVTPKEITELSPNTAMAVERYLNKTINKIRPNSPNVVITTAEGKTFLQTLNAYRHHSTETIEVNNIKYHQYMGIPIVDLPDSYFPANWMENGIPVIFMLIDSVNGVHCAVPMDGKVLDIVTPAMGGDGVLVKTGACEMATVPIMSVYPFAIAMGTIKETGAVEAAAVDGE